jgi:hypothetical protein
MPFRRFHLLSLSEQFPTDTQSSILRTISLGNMHRKEHPRGLDHGRVLHMQFTLASQLVIIHGVGLDHSRP